MDSRGNIHDYPAGERVPDAQFEITQEEKHALRNVPLNERHCELGVLRQVARLKANGIQLNDVELARCKQWFRAGFRCAFGEGMS